MKSFKTFLTEAKSTFSTADFAKTIESSRHVEAFDVRGSEWLRDKGLPRLIELLNKYATGDVPNPVVKDIKDLANRFFENALNKPEHVYAIIRATRNFSLEDGISEGLPYSNTIAGRLKRAIAGRNKNTNPEFAPYYDWAVAILTELEPVAQMVESIKTRAVKRQPKPVEDRHEKYVAPMAKFESGQVILAALRKMTDAMKDDYARSVTEYYTDVVEAYAKLSYDEQQKQYRNTANQFRVWNHGDGSRWHQPKTLVANYRAILKAEGERAAKDMQEGFIYKNAKKLRSIAETKGIALVNEPTPKNLHVGNGTYEGELDFSFADGSKFTVRNKVVIKRNNYGTVFAQYPTTFHDVVLPGGVKMPSPSEERMNTVFAVTK